MLTTTCFETTTFTDRSLFIGLSCSNPDSVSFHAQILTVSSLYLVHGHLCHLLFSKLQLPFGTHFHNLILHFKQKLYQHRPQIAKTHFCVINVEKKCPQP